MFRRPSLIEALIVERPCCRDERRPSIPMSLDKAVSLSKLLLESGSQSRGESTLELEALAAVHQLSHAVQSISVSEMLPRTPELIFVNLTTAEGQPYCLELTHKGWRVTSLRSDCMQGDFTRMELFTKYYDSLYDLMEVLSPGYKQRFGEKVSQKLRMYENCDEYPACACSPPIRPDNSSSCSTTSDADSS
ncbi:unnamed protein product [Bursaphelenchus xylophilus]|uniref:(pine wood nematode) hypothetical protein n=1 Tax=Bursaphelenchus xylophilus TaxID=6326 RepID=A0A1I7RNV4_BURXY|nr:unnamed protein product [Bursaphelenchus xylophilus]CAG9124322.1 unnamed protein product [Bursaphelenchus xylophilus]